MDIPLFLFRYIYHTYCSLKWINKVPLPKLQVLLKSLLLDIIQAVQISHNTCLFFYPPWSDYFHFLSLLDNLSLITYIMICIASIKTGASIKTYDIWCPLISTWSSGYGPTVLIISFSYFEGSSSDRYFAIFTVFWYFPTCRSITFSFQ